MINLYRHGGVEVLCCRAPIVGEQVEAIMKSSRLILEKGIPDWIIDLQHVPLIDSRGLEMLLTLRDQTLEKMGTMKLSGPNALLREVLTITGLEREFEIYSSLSSAAGSFSL